MYKAPWMQSASFSEAYFNLKSASETEVGKRSSESSLMFIQITEASQVVPHPTTRPLFLDVKQSSDITDSNAPRPSQAFRGFKFHKIILVEGDTCTMQVAIPHLEGQDTHHMITYQKPQMIPEFCMSETIAAPLAIADEHWNILNDPVYPACLEGFKNRHQASQTSQAKGSTSKAGTSEKGVTLMTTLPSEVAFHGLVCSHSHKNMLRDLNILQGLTVHNLANPALMSSHPLSEVHEEAPQLSLSMQL